MTKKPPDQPQPTLKPSKSPPPKFTDLDAETQQRLLSAISRTPTDESLLTTILGRPYKLQRADWLDYTGHTDESLNIHQENYYLSIEAPETLPHVRPCSISYKSTSNTLQYE